MPQIIDSYSESNYNSIYSIDAVGKKGGQSFTGNGGTLNSVKFYMTGLSDPVGNIYASIYEHTGEYGASSLGTGTALAKSTTVNLNTLTTNFALVEFTFSGANKITLEDGTYYVVVVESDDISSGTAFIGMDGISASHSGNSVYYESTWGWYWYPDYDTCFYVYADTVEVDTDDSRGAKVTGGIASSRGAKVTGGIASSRGAKVTGGIASSRGAKVTGFYLGNSMESAGSLKSDDSPLTTAYTETDDTNIATDNDVFVDLSITDDYSTHLFLVENEALSEKIISINVKVKSGIATSTKTVYLEIYNYDTEEWEEIDSESSASAGTEFALTGTVSTNLSNYYNDGYMVSVRVWQGVNK